MQWWRLWRRLNEVGPAACAAGPPCPAARSSGHGSKFQEQKGTVNPRDSSPPAPLLVESGSKFGPLCKLTGLNWAQPHPRTNASDETGIGVYFLRAPACPSVCLRCTFVLFM